MNCLDNKGFAESFGVNQNELSDIVLKEIKKYNFNYTEIPCSKYLSLILEILKRIDNDKQKIGADEREKVWFDGWNENLNEFKNSGYKYEALIPKFVRPNNPIRLNQEYVLPEDKNFELNFINVYRTWFLEKYFSDFENIFEFGCGTGFNLLRASELFPEKFLFGSDFVQSSVDLVNLISKSKKLNLKGSLFNMLSPDKDYNIPPNSGIFTFGALEQLASDLEPMINYLIQRKPSLCLHTEPAIELYDIQNSLEDYLAAKFQSKRGYSSGLISKLKILEKDKKIKIIKIKRLNFGSLFLEGYNLIIWKPL